MGLDIVETFMAVERRFEIRIENSEAETAQTVGGLHELVLAKLEARGRKPADRSEADWRNETWRRLVEVVSDQIAVDPNELRPDARFVDDLRLD